MEKKSIGSFLAALRKASGLTQEEVAQRLYVSNKTVSKWERDESSPDLATIPVLAELFQVTCDEILRGERIPQGAPDDSKGRAKAEKQAKYIANRTVSQFKSVSYIAAALTLAGLILQFAVAYTYYKPLMAFGLALICLLCSILVEAIQLNHAKTALQEGALLDEGNFRQTAHAKSLHRMAFLVFVFNAWAFLLILPLVMTEGLDYVNSALTFGAYLSQLPLQLFICLVLTAAAVYFVRDWLGLDLDKSGALSPLLYKTAAIQRLLWIQTALLLGTVCRFIAPILYTMQEGRISQTIMVPFVILTLLCPIGVVVTFILWYHKGKKGLERFIVLLLSLRNLLLTVTAFMALKYVGVSTSPAYPSPRLNLPGADVWNNLILQWMLIFAAYLAVKYFLVKRLAGDNMTPPSPQESGI